MKFQFIRIDYNSSSRLSKIWYLDVYGQPRFLELSGGWREKEAIELLNEIERMFL